MEELQERLAMIKTIADKFNYWSSNLQDAAEIIHTISEIADGDFSSIAEEV